MLIIFPLITVSGFGGAFFWMIFTKFFFDHEKKVHWIPGLERIMSSMGNLEALWAAVSMFTIKLVADQALSTYRYLENVVFWAKGK